MKRLLVLFLTVIIWIALLAPASSGVKMLNAEGCYVPKGTAALKINHAGALLQGKLKLDLTGYRIEGELPAELVQPFAVMYSGDWAGALVLKYVYNCPKHGSENTTFVVKPADIVCKPRTKNSQ